MKVKMKANIDIDWVEVSEKMAKELEAVFNKKTKSEGFDIDVELEHELYDEEK